MPIRTNLFTYAIIPIADLSKINFNEIVTTSADTIRKNLAETQFIIKYSVTPLFITDGSVTPDSVLTHAECLELVATDTWVEPIPNP